MVVKNKTVDPNDLEFYNAHVTDLKIVGAGVEEQSTVINLDRSEKFALVETTDNLMLSKLSKRVADGEWEVVHVTVPAEEHSSNEITSITMKGNKNLITIRSKKVTHVMTEEQRAAAAERLRAARNSRSGASKE